ncbi:MAG TPA: hypothetical protein VK206_00100 [Anaerolineales bacterium]|nr:hypothetical protein [Anaerolineales bacterium]
MELEIQHHDGLTASCNQASHPEQLPVLEIGSNMKNKSKSDHAKDQHSKTWQLIALRLLAVFLIIVFLASECAPLFSR